MALKSSALYSYDLPGGFICKQLELSDTGMLFAYCEDDEGRLVVIMLKKGTVALVPKIVSLE